MSEAHRLALSRLDFRPLFWYRLTYRFWAWLGVEEQAVPARESNRGPGKVLGAFSLPCFRTTQSADTGLLDLCTSLEMRYLLWVEKRPTARAGPTVCLLFCLEIITYYTQKGITFEPQIVLSMSRSLLCCWPPAGHRRGPTRCVRGLHGERLAAGLPVSS